LAKRKVDGLSFKAGPTQSGATPTPTPTAFPVGGEVVGIDTLSVFLSTYWPLIVALMIPLAFAFYKKRSAIPKWFVRLMYSLKGL
jgi:hypothetical protein